MRFPPILGGGLLVVLTAAGARADEPPGSSPSPPRAQPEAWRSHWASRPVHAPAVPAVREGSWAASPIDRFILARLEEKGLNPSPRADRRTLIRRATFDLTGLPPTPAEVEAFEYDPSPDAFATVVDRLLASPRYGERWGRHWLDVARYADTKGYVFDDERVFPCAYSYRDYVIRAFNEDIAYDRFLREQLAADRLPLGSDRRPLAALGFLTLGGRFMNNRHDIIDDRIDVVTRGLLGLTVTCARCHDHKFDPIPAEDYYSLYGVFASSEEPRALPVVAAPERNGAYRVYERRLQELEAKLLAFLREQHAELTASFRSRTGDYLLAAQAARRQPATDEFMFVIEAGDLNPMVVQRWRGLLDRARRRHDRVFDPWQALAALPAEEFEARAASLARAFAANADPARPLNPLVAAAFAGPAPRNLAEVAARYGRLLVGVEKQWRERVKSGGAVAGRLDDPACEELRRVLYGPDAPPDVLPDQSDHYILDRVSRGKLQALRREIEHFQGTSPEAPARAMVLVDAATPTEPYVFVRGNPAKRGKAVPRRILRVIAGEPAPPFRRGSGRLELAEAVADPKNPLTARVIVNRIWMHHFGQGLVRTPSDFGLRSDPPSHPELLDYLATRFVEDGWSVKKMHRLLLLSSVYQQAGADSENGRRSDPENRLLWRMNRRRLDFEALRDAMLAVSGSLDARMGGPSVDLGSQLEVGRRTVYGFVDRQNLPGVLRTFDFPSPDTTCPQRYQTTVPLQALYLLNSPFVAERARRLLRQPAVEGCADPTARVRALHRLLFGRDACAADIDLAREFVGRPDEAGAPGSADALGPWERYAQVLLSANEFAFLD